MSTTPTPLLLAIDQGTSSTKTLVFDREGRVVARASVPLRSIYEGDHAEQSPEEILQNVKDSVHACLDDLRSRNGNTSDILSMGISNQRETFIVWDDTGKPLYNAILWQCKRSTEICDRLAAQGLSSTIKEITGQAFLRIVAAFFVTSDKD